TSALIAHILRRHGRTVGLACARGALLDRRRLSPGDGRSLAGAQALLLNPAAEAAVLEATPAGILETGLGFDRAEVVVLAEAGARAENAAAVARTLAAVVVPTGTLVLDVDALDTRAETLAASCPGAVLLVARDAQQPRLAAHRRAGGHGA